MIGIVIVPSKNEDIYAKNIEKPLNKRSFWVVAGLEVMGNIVLTVGLFYVGSGVESLNVLIEP